MQPTSIFAAHFIGESNFLEGYVLSKNEETIVELRGDIRVSVSHAEFGAGERLVLAIRPEAFSAERGVTKGNNHIQGLVERITFEGTNVRYEIRLENEDLIVLVRLSLSEERFNIGERVTVAFPPDKVHAFKYPEKGLKEEMSVE
jgi:ABC-type Fe3+/spermidine/putrescine transport system ATPase subunit